MHRVDRVTGGGHSQGRIAVGGLAIEFRFRDEDESFRQEVRAFLADALPEDWRSRWTGLLGHPPKEFYGLEMEVRGKLARKGWLALPWPVEYGGGGADVLRQAVFTEEVEHLRAPGRDMVGITQVGPLLMAHGSAEQRVEHLGRIARGEVIWAQGFSEPEAGSDLASLQTRAVRDGDDFVINGQKVWTSGAHRADWLHVLTRTDPDAPKHKGISYFLVKADTPGIDVRPLHDMAGGHMFNEVFFKDVRVPASNMLGEENLGWYVATTTLNHERSNVAYSALLRGLLDEALAHLRTLGPAGPLMDPLVRHKLADLTVGVQVSRMLAYRVAWLQHSGQHPSYEASVSKLYSAELHRRVPAMLMEIIGLYGQLETNARLAPMAGGVQYTYRQAVAATIGGGTVEIQRNLIATRGLGLPR